MWQQFGIWAVAGVWGAVALVALARRFAPQLETLAARARQSRMSAALAVLGLGAIVAYAGGKYTIVYDRVDSDASGDMTNEQAVVNAPYQLRANQYELEGSVFAGWSTNEADKVYFEDCATVMNLAEEDGTNTLKAVWRKLLTEATAASQTYTGSALTPVLTVKAGEVTLEVGDYTVDEWSGDLKDAGAYTATVTGTGKFAGTTTVSFSITPKGLTVKDLVAQYKVYDGTVAATIEGGTLDGVVEGDDVDATMPTSGTFADKDVGTDKKVTFEPIVLEGDDAENYALTAQPELKASITPKGLTVAGLAAKDKVYDGTTAATIEGGTLDGVVEGDDVDATMPTSGTFADKDVGTDVEVKFEPIELTGAAKGNYALTQPELAADITKADLSVTADDKDVALGADAPAFTVQYEGFVNGEDKSVLGGELAFDCAYDKSTAKTGDTFDITPKGLTSDNYEIAFVDGTLTVGKGTPAPDGQLTMAITYGTTLGEGTVVGTMKYNDEEVAGTFEFADSGKVPTVAESGDYAATFKPEDSGSYNDAPVQVAVTVGKKTLTVKDLVAQDKTYDGTTAAVIEGGALDGVVGSDDVTATMPKQGTFDDKDVGTDKAVTFEPIELAGAAAANYTLTQPELKAEITKKDLTVKASDCGVALGADAPKFKVGYEGFVSDENEGVLGGKLAFDCDYDKQTAQSGDTFDITPKGLTSGNYEITFVKGTLTVGKVTPEPEGTVTMAITYGTKLGEGTVVGKMVYEETEVPGVFVFANPDKIPTVIESGNFSATFKPGDSDNYTDADVAVAVTVSKKALTVKGIEAQNKTYDGTTAAVIEGGELVGVVEGDDVTAEMPAAGEFADKDVGTDKAVTFGDIELTGAKETNYTLTQPELKADITKADLSVTADDKDVALGADAPEFTVQYDGFVADEDESVLGGTLAFDCDYNKATAKTGDTFDITPKGLTSDNYEISFVKGTLTVGKGTPEVDDPLTMEIVYGKTLGEGKVVGSMTCNGVIVDGEFEFADPDQVPTVAESGDYAATFKPEDPDSYNEVSVQVSVTVSKKWLIVTTESFKITYGDEPPAYTTNAVVGFVEGDDISVISGKATFSCDYEKGSDVGTYKIDIDVSGLEADNYEFEGIYGELEVAKAKVNKISGRPSQTGWMTGETPVPADLKNVTADFGTPAAVYYSDEGCTTVFVPSEATEAGTYWVRAEVAETANYAGASTEAVSFKVRPEPGTKEALEKAFAGIGLVEPDGDDWKVTLTGDSQKTIELPSDLGFVTLDLAGHDLAGEDGADGSEDVPGKAGTPAIRVVLGSDVGDEPLKLTIVGDGSVAGGAGGAGSRGGDGAAGVSFDMDVPNGACVNIAEAVQIAGGAGGDSVSEELAANGGAGGAGIDGDVGVNYGSILGGVGGGAVAGAVGKAGAGVTGEIKENHGVIEDGESYLEVPKSLYLDRPLSDFGVNVPEDVDFANGDKVAIKLEGMVKGLKLVSTAIKVDRKVVGYAYTLQGVPADELLFGTQTAYARITVTYKDKTKGEKGKVVLLQPIRMQVVAQLADEFPAGRLAEDYTPFSVSDIWPDVEANPKEWSFKGWPSGIKYTTKLVTKKNKDKTVTTNALPYQIYGKPTKAGVYTVTATHNHKIGGKSVKELFYATLTVWGTEPEEKSIRYTNQAYVEIENIQLGQDVKKVGGLPAGLKFTTKEVSSVAKPYQIYGTPTKAGVFAVTLTKTDPENAKKTVNETFLWKILPGENFGALAYLALDKGTAPEKARTITAMQGAKRDWTLAVPEGSKVTASGLPSGLKLVQDKETKTYSFAGVPTKAGEYVVTIKTVRNGVTVTERVAIHVAANAYTGSHVGVMSVDCTRASMSLDVKVAAAGGVTVTLVENTTKTTAKAKNFEIDNATVLFNLPKNNKVPGSVDRELVLNFASNTVTIAGKADFALWHAVAPADPEEIRTFVIEDTGDAPESYACVTAAYDAKKNTYALTGSLEDGTKVKATVSAVTDGEHEAFAPILVTDKAKTVRLLWLSATEGGALLDVREDGELIEDVELAETEPFKKADVSKKKFNVVTADDALITVFSGMVDPPTILTDKLLKTSLDATGSVTLKVTDDDGWTAACQLLPYRDEGGALHFRGIATKTKKNASTKFGGIAFTENSAANE